MVLASFFLLFPASRLNALSFLVEAEQQPVIFNSYQGKAASRNTQDKRGGMGAAESRK